MNRRYLLVIGVLATIGIAVGSRRLLDVVRPGLNAQGVFTMPNGWRIKPAGTSFGLPGDMPGNIMVLKDGKQALVNTCGFHDHSLNLIDLDSMKVLSTVPFERSWMGLCLDADGNALISGGLANRAGRDTAIHKVSISSELTAAKGFDLPGVDPKLQFVSGLLETPSGLLVLNIQTDEALLMSADGKVLARAILGYRPYEAALSPDGKTLAVSNWGDKSVSLLDPATLRLQTKIETRAMPSALTYAKDGRLIVSESGSNTVAIIDGDHVAERVRTGIDPTYPVGVTPTALALSPDSKTLYVADSGNNCVTVISIVHRGSSRVLGLIPTERYPSALAVTPDGKKLLVSTAKGYYGPNNVPANATGDAGVRGGQVPHKYIGNQLEGRFTVIRIPDAKQLQIWTRQVFLNRPRGMEMASANHSAIQGGAFSKIKHVLYVIRENRAFDQVMGDIGKGEADPSLVLFGRKVTPNGHKLLNTFTLFDNLYTDGEVSQAGHQWTDAAYANDYNEKQWILSYSRHEEIESDRRLSSSPGEYIWSQARKHGLKARVFGEYVDVQEDHDSLQIPAIKADPEKYGYSAAFEKIFARGGRDVEKVDEFLGEMHQAETKGDWPSMMVMALPEDHTRGFSAGAFSPYAMVGDNDQAIGKLIEGISHSKFWKDTAVFIIEDDAQDGADHIDSHRTVGLVVSPYIRRGNIDSTMYSTSSMLRTMELILGLPPMTQYDAHATPMYAAFTTKPSFEPYDNAPPEVDLNERNPAKTALARRSAKQDFSDIDRADPDEFNHILWEGYRPHDPYPAMLR